MQFPGAVHAETWPVLRSGGGFIRAPACRSAEERHAMQASHSACWINTASTPPPLIRLQRDTSGATADRLRMSSVMLIHWQETPDQDGCWFLPEGQKVIWRAFQHWPLTSIWILWINLYFLTNKYRQTQSVERRSVVYSEFQKLGPISEEINIFFAFHSHENFVLYQ